MDPSRYQRVRALTEQLLDIDASSRAHQLVVLTVGDETLRADVEALLKSIEAADQSDFLEPARRRLSSEYFGGGEQRYRIIRELGQGGMGTVYLAERSDGEYVQQIALKTLHVGAAFNPALIERLRAERQILAQLQHPNIARLLDGGTDSTGRPFLAMEYVDGERIDRWCEKHKLDVAARVRLFLQVCDAVQYAHQQLVIHRDIKPSNILVDAAGSGKLLDFGIAQLIVDGESTDTNTTDRLLTYRYASPEQIRGERVGTSSDIYSLAMVLFRILTGQHPYAREDSSPPELARAIQEDVPRHPSRSVTSEQGKLAGTGDPSELARQLAGDLDSIVLRALRKAPEERYASVGQFSDDLRRYLAGQPVFARQGQRGYAFRKFVSRHRWAVASGVASLGLLVAFVVILSVQLDKTRVQRDRANAVTAFITRMFAATNPMLETAGSAEDRSQITVREVLDREAPRIQSELSSQPEVQAELLDTVGQVYFGLDQRDNADKYLGAALVLREQIDPAPSPEKRDLLTKICEAQGLRGRERTLETCEKAIAMARQFATGDDAAVARALRNRAASLNTLGRYDEARADAESSLAMFERLDEKDWVASLNLKLAQIAYNQGDPQTCLTRSESAIARWTEAFGRNHALLSFAISQRASCRLAIGELAAAEADMREALTLIEQALGKDAPVANRAAMLNELALVLNQQGRFAEAEPMLREARRIALIVYGDNHPEFQRVLLGLSMSVDGQGRVDEGLDLMRQALAIARDQPSDQRGLALTLNNLGFRLVREGRHAEAEPLLRESLATYLSIDPEHPERAAALVNLGTLLTETDRATEALPLLREGLALREQTMVAGSWPIEVARSVLGTCLFALNEKEEGLRLLRSAHASLTDAFGPGHRRSMDAERRLRKAEGLTP